MSLGTHLADLTLRIGNDDAPGVVAELAAICEPPGVTVEALRRHHLVGLVVRAIADAGSWTTLPNDLVEAIEANRPPPPVPPAELLDAFEELAASLSEHGIPALQLKGLVFAERFYGGLDRRPQYDIDVLVPRRRLRAAARLLEQRGYRRESYDLHSRTLLRGKLKVDLHRTLRWAPAYRIDERAVWSGARVAAVGGRQIQTISDDHTLLLLVLSIYEDAGQGSAKLKQLLDLLLLAADLDSTIDWVAFLARREAEGVRRIAVNVLALMISVFEAAELVPHLTATLAPHLHEVVLTSRQAALDLLLAPRKDPANLSWFRAIYPGSFTAYIAWFWAAGFPANLRDPGRASIRETVRVTIGRSDTPPTG